MFYPACCMAETSYRDAFLVYLIICTKLYCILSCTSLHVHYRTHYIVTSRTIFWNSLLFSQTIILFRRFGFFSFIAPILGKAKIHEMRSNFESDFFIQGPELCTRKSSFSNKKATKNWNFPLCQNWLLLITRSPRIIIS